jgi:hypothetical protein
MEDMDNVIRGAPQDEWEINPADSIVWGKKTII